MSEVSNHTEQQVEVSFSNFVMGLATAALSQLGVVEDPISKKKTVNLTYARQHIDTLVMLSEKTMKNLNPEEEQLIGQILTDLRMRFVEVSKSQK